ncbi:protein BIG GRAIN 1-like A [Primulina eburnea]|uniref:protein BIG GRAIN 1-like A n=1 Tax=Primulina eburnea TaxID=1245227 RepID=UPI003C6C4258
MYTREKSRKNHHNEPSFSSTLLDEIYRSIDKNADNTEDSKFFFYRDNNKLVKGRVNFRGGGNYSSSHRVEDEKMAGFRRPGLVDKWMLKEANENLLARRDSLVAESENKSFQDKDLSYFSSISSSSDSSGALSSSSDSEFFISSTKSRVSCFSSVEKPKHVRIVGKNKEDEELDDYKMGDDDLFKSKSRALKIYASLRKVKQPISPGGKLTSFINSLFNHANEKKLRNFDSNRRIQVQDLKSMETSSNCSSARSCLSMKREKIMRNGIQRTVRFDPVSVIFNEGSRPCGSKSIIGEESKGCGRHSSAPNQLDDLKLRLRVKNMKVEEGDTQNDKKTDAFRQNSKTDAFRQDSHSKVEEDDEDDAMSDSSSDLFELDHLLFGHNRFCEDLPMYETTHFGTNRAIGSGLIT